MRATAAGIRATAAGLWATAGLVVLLSVLVHGVSATPVMNWLDRRRSQEATSRGESPDATAVPV